MMRCLPFKILLGGRGYFLPVTCRVKLLPRCEDEVWHRFVRVIIAKHPGGTKTPPSAAVATGDVEHVGQGHDIAEDADVAGHGAKLS